MEDRIAREDRDYAKKFDLPEPTDWLANKAITGVAIREDIE
jgi:hypothetical protein